MPQPTNWKPILMLPFLLCTGLPSGLLPWGCTTKTVCVPLPFPNRTWHTPIPPHYSWFYNLHVWWEVQIIKPLDPVTSSIIGRNIFLSTPFSRNLSLCNTLNVRDQVSHPYTYVGACQNCTARPRIADKSTLWVASNMLNQQSWTDEKGWGSSRLEVRQGANTSSP